MVSRWPLATTFRIKIDSIEEVWTVNANSDLGNGVISSSSALGSFLLATVQGQKTTFTQPDGKQVKCEVVSIVPPQSSDKAQSLSGTNTKPPRHIEGCWSYLDYIHSEEWRKKSARIKDKQKSVCRLCGKRENLQTHHLTYIRLGNEKEDDLVGLCEDCHTKIHFLVESYRMAYARYAEALRWSWRDAVRIKTMPYSGFCMLCNVNKDLDTTYDASSILQDLMSICEACRWVVFASAVKYRAQYYPYNVSLAYGLRDAKRNAKYKKSKGA